MGEQVGGNKPLWLALAYESRATDAARLGSIESYQHPIGVYIDFDGISIDSDR